MKVKDSIFFKLTKKDGISLVVLVVTIIVIVILAVAVVMSLNNNNILINSSSSRYMTDLDTMQSYLELAIQNVSTRHQGTLEVESGEILLDETSNVKESRGIIKWDSVDIGNLSGEIIFDEGEDTDTSFYTGYRLPIYGSETKWYVDDRGKLVMKTGSRIYGATDIPNRMISPRMVLNEPTKYYGTYVNYKPKNGLSEDYKWRIFYATSQNIFLITEDYIDLRDVAITNSGKMPINVYNGEKSIKSAPLTNILDNYEGTNSVKNDMKWLNMDYFNKNYSSITDASKAIAYLLDKDIWSNKFVGKGAKYAIGGPSLEMFLNSYNQKMELGNKCQARADSNLGYSASSDAGKNFSYMTILTNATDLYYISDTSEASKYYLSTTSSKNNVNENLSEIFAFGMRFLGTGSVHSSNSGFRPIVCLDTYLVETEDENVYDLNI